MFNLASTLSVPMASATPGPLDPFWYQPAQAPGPSGIVVKPDTGLKVGPVFACIRVLRESIGSLPWEVFEWIDAKKLDTQLASDHYLTPILGRKPNAWQTPISFKELIVTHVCLRGNFYARIVPLPGQEFGLQPLNPDKMDVDQLADGSLRYTYKPKPGIKEVYPASEIFHVVGLSLNGITGVSVLEYAANTVGLSIAQQTHGASLFRNGGLPAFWISRPGGIKWTADAKRNFRQGWRKIHGGPENAGNPPILADGMELHELGLSNRDSQWLESLDFNAIDMCRFFGVPPHMIGIRGEDPADIEQTGIEFVRFTLHPLATRIEEAANRDLILDPEKNYTRFDLDSLQSGDMTARYTAHNTAIQGGWKLINEARREEGYNPIEGGDKPRFPLNMQPAGGGPDWNEQGGPPGKGKKKSGDRSQETEDTEDDPTREEKRRANKAAKKAEAVRATFAPLLHDAACRIAAAEIRGLESRADKAAADRPKWNVWAKDFYAEHALFVKRVLDPISQAWAVATGREPARLDIANVATHRLLNCSDVAAEIARMAEKKAISYQAATLLDRLEQAFFAP